MATTTIKKDAPILLRKSYTYKVASVGKSATATVTAENFGISVPAGYVACGVYGAYCSNASVLMVGFRAVSSGTIVYLRNFTDTAVTNVNTTIYVTYVREDMAGIVDG